MIIWQYSMEGCTVHRGLTFRNPIHPDRLTSALWREACGAMAPRGGGRPPLLLPTLLPNLLGEPGLIAWSGGDEKAGWAALVSSL